MDFQSAMETFAEAWVAANTKSDPVQSQALALTHKSSPPSRPSSVSPLPQSPQSHQSNQAHSTRSPTPRPSSVHHHHQHHQQQQPTSIQSQQQHHHHHSQSFGIHQTRHPKQELDSISPKPEGFDLSKNSTVSGKSPVPVHCVVEAINSIVETRFNIGRDKWQNPHIEIDTYVIIPAAVPFHDLVGEALIRLGYPTDLIPSSRGCIIVKNWKPLEMENIADDTSRSVGEILAELTTVATLKIQIYRVRPQSPTPASEVRDKLLRLLLLHSHALLVSAGCPLDEITLSSLCRGGNDLNEETKRSFDTWLQQQQHLAGLGPSTTSMLAACTHNNNNNNNININNNNNNSNNNNRQINNQSPIIDTGLITNTTSHHHHHHHPSSMLPYSHKTRMRTSFDPELELPRLQRWFSENQHPSRQQIQRYVTELNLLESRRGRKPLDVNNVVYWFKNARAAQKRAETRGINGYSPPGLSPRGASIVSEDCSDEEEDLQHQSNSASPCPPGINQNIVPLSLTTRSDDQRLINQISTPIISSQTTTAATTTTTTITTSPTTTTTTTVSTPIVKREDDTVTRVSSGSDDEDSPNNVPTAPLPPGFSLVPSPMFGHGIMYMSHYLPTRGGPAGCPASILDERRKRNRTFIDPVTEVPRLENWFGHNTHPSHALILKYTEELNRMPYRQKFPRLEPKNVQFWFKNRRAKCKRLKMAFFEGESPQQHPYAHPD